MKQVKSRKHIGSFCYRCAAKMPRYYLTCKFCDKLIVSNLYFLLFIIVGLIGVLFLTLLLRSRYF